MRHNSFIIHLRTFFSLILGVVLLACLTATAWAQQDDTELAAQSNITKVNLPSGAVRVRERSVPASISGTLQKLVAAGGGKIAQGDAEVLAWAGGDYSKAKAASLMTEMQGNLQAGGWRYELHEKADAVNFFSAVRETPTRRAILGFFVPTDDALVIAWTEIFAAGSTAPTESNSQPSGNTRTERIEAAHNEGSGGAREIVGTWGGGGMSLLQERNTVTNSVTPSNGSRIKYVFTADGRFEHVGLLQSTVYGCTTTLFNDKRGTYQINGSNITLTPSKNFWRQQNNCAPNSTKERDYTLDPETLVWRTKTDEYGKQFICLTGKNGESCHRREN